MWSLISNLGDAALTLPVALACAVWLAVTDRRLAVRWVVCLAAGMALVGLTKILYAGCGIEFQQFDFRVVSGHTMLATAVWTVTFSLLWGNGATFRWVAPVAGLSAGAIMGAVRVFEDAHTVSEAIAGWIVGALVALFFLRARSARLRLSSPIIAGVGLLLVTSIAYGHRSPIQGLIVEYSPTLCTNATATLSHLF